MSTLTVGRRRPGPQTLKFLRIYAQILVIYDQILVNFVQIKIIVCCKLGVNLFNVLIYKFEYI